MWCEEFEANNGSTDTSAGDNVENGPDVLADGSDVDDDFLVQEAHKLDVDEALLKNAEVSNVLVLFVVVVYA